MHRKWISWSWFYRYNGTQFISFPFDLANKSRKYGRNCLLLHFLYILLKCRLLNKVILHLLLTSNANTDRYGSFGVPHFFFCHTMPLIGSGETKSRKPDIIFISRQFRSNLIEIHFGFNCKLVPIFRCTHFLTRLFIWCAHCFAFYCSSAP